MRPHLFNRLSATVGSRHIRTFTTVLVVASCAGLGAALGMLFPMRSLVSLQPRAFTIEEHGNSKEPAEPVGNLASPVLLLSETAKTSPSREGSAPVVAVPTTPSRSHRALGKAAPIETDNPCRWSQSPDGTLTCAGRQVMGPGPGDPLRVRQCGMVFRDKVHFSGIEMRVVSRQPKANPFLVRSADDWKLNFDAPNSTVVKVIFTADAAESGNVVCQFSYHLQKAY
jgi:hypothetical protein